MNTDRIKPLLGMILVLATTLACRFLSPAPSTPPTPSVAAGPTAGSQASLFTDDFSSSDSGWETDNTPDYVIDYASETLRIKVWTDGDFTWSHLQGRNFKDIHFEVTVRDQDPAHDHSFGLICDQQVKGGHAEVAHYFLGVDPYGYYLIGKRVLGKDDVNLASSGDWTSTDAFPKNADSYRIGADCGHGTLTLYVNGAQIYSAQDATYAEGEVGLFLWSGHGSVGPVEFDDVSITALK